MKLKFRKSISDRDQHLVTGLSGHEDLKNVRVIERYVFVRDRADGSQTILDTSAVIKVEGHKRTSAIIVMHLTHSASQARELNKDGNYFYTQKEARGGRFHSISETDIETTLVRSQAKKLGKGWIPTATLNRHVRHNLGGLAQKLRNADFALVKMAKRNMKCDENLRWTGVNDNWRIPSSKLFQWRAAKIRAKALLKRNDWIKKGVKTAREVL